MIYPYCTMSTHFSLLRPFLRRPGLVLKQARSQLLPSQYSYSTSPNDQKLYELRTYTVKPASFKQFLDLSTEWMHLRTSHSKLVGYWITEIGGGIHDVVHIWEYDSLSHRASVRQALAKDETWISSYFSKLMAMLQRQENSLLRLFPGSKLVDPPNPGTGVYELETFSINPAKLEETGNYIIGRQKHNGVQLGTFYTTIGMNYFGYQLWHHPTVDNVLQLSEQASQPHGDHEKAKDLGVVVFQSRMLLPTPWSTMK